MTKIALFASCSIVTMSVLLALSGPLTAAGNPNQRPRLIRSMPAASPAPYGMTAGGRVAPLLYPGNANALGRHFVSPMLVARDLNIGTQKSGLDLQSAQLRRYSDLSLVRNHGLILHMIANDRMVYEIVTTFKTEQVVRGNHWSSGRKTFIIDAESGKIIAIQTIGNMTVNAGVRRFDTAYRRVGRPLTAQQHEILMEKRSAELHH